LITLVVTDPSSVEGISINVFGEIESKLPAISGVGDVFRAHRLQVSTFNNKLQGVGNSKQGFSFLIVNNLDGLPSLSSRHCTFFQSDIERIKALKLWWENADQR
jgi:hypothetical protein